MKNTEINKGVIIQEDQQTPTPLILPNHSMQARHIDVGVRRLLQNATAIVGSSVDVLNSAADFSSIQSAINYVNGLGGGKIFVLNGTYNENLTVPSYIFLEGQGHKTTNTGTINLTGNGSMIKYMRNDGNITFDPGTDYNRVTDCWISSASNVINSGLVGNTWDISAE